MLPHSCCQSLPCLCIKLRIFHTALQHAFAQSTHEFRQADTKGPAPPVMQATMVVADAKESLTITGNGDVVEPHDGVVGELPVSVWSPKLPWATP